MPKPQNKIKELEKEVKYLKKVLNLVVEWIDFWETVPTPWKKPVLKNRKDK